jgi:ABC-type spermidine/putrescine transport system permease subunit II
MKKSALDRTIDMIIITFFIVYVFVPIFIAFQYAFAEKWFPSHWWFPQELGLKWFKEIFALSNIVKSLILSYIIGFFVTLFTLIIALLAGYVLGTRTFRESFKTTRLMENLSNIPLAFPAITLGLGLLPVYARLGILNTIPGVIFAHMVMAVPYALRSIVGAFLTIPPDYEEAARNLGAGRLYIIRKIYLPLVWPGILAGAVFAFTWSLNEFVLTLFLGYPKIETIPVQIYYYVGGYYLQPQTAAALSLFLLLPSLFLMYLIEKVTRAGSIVAMGA